MTVVRDVPATMDDGVILHANIGYPTTAVGGVAVAVVQFFDLAGGITGTKHLPENTVDGAALKSDILSGGDRAYNRSYWIERSSDTRVENIVRVISPHCSGLAGKRLRRSLAVSSCIPICKTLRQIARCTDRCQRVSPHSENSRSLSGRPAGHGQGLDKTLQLLWYDHWVKQKDTRIDRITTGMHLYEVGADRWVNASSWPITDNYTPFYLSNSGLVTSPVTHTANVAFGDPATAGTTVSYDSEVFAKDQTLAGPMGATLYISSSNTNADFVTTIFDVAPDNSAVEFTAGGLIASARALAADRSWSDVNGLATKPEGAFATNDPLIPGHVYRLDIKVQAILRRIQKGHKLRLVIGTQAGAAKCGGQLGLGRPNPCLFNSVQTASLNGGTYTIVSDANHPSSINMPLVDPSSLPTAASALTETSPSQTQPITWGTTRSKFSR